MANLYDLSKERALFKIPFLRANMAPITWFELADREKGVGVKLYTPTRQIQDFKPIEYMGTVGSCGDLTLSYQNPGWARLEIREIPRSCEKRDNMLNSATQQKYEEIYNKDGIVVQFEATPPSTHETFFRWLHKIYIGDTLVIVYPTPFNKLSERKSSN